MFDEVIIVTDHHLQVDTDSFLRMKGSEVFKFVYLSYINVHLTASTLIILDLGNGFGST